MRIFISHAHVDRIAFVNSWLVPTLTNAGHDVWIDDNLTAGHQWQTQLARQITNSDVVVYALSPEAVKSKVCRWEIGRAFKEGTPVVPVLCQKTKMPRWLASLQYVDFTGGPNPTTDAKLHEALSKARPQVHPIMPPRYSPREMLLAGVGLIILVALIAGLVLALSGGKGDDHEADSNLPTATSDIVTCINYSDDPATAHYEKWGANIVICLAEANIYEIRICRSQGQCTGYADTSGDQDSRMGGFNFIFSDGSDGEVYTVNERITGDTASCMLEIVDNFRYCGVPVEPHPPSPSATISATQTPTVSPTSSPTETTTATPTPTNTSTVTPSPTFTAEVGMIFTGEVAPIATAIPSHIVPTVTLTPTSTETSTATALQTTAKNYPCDGTIINPDSQASVINVIHLEASTNSALGGAIRVGSIVQLKRKTTDDTSKEWYLIYDGVGRLGWIPVRNITPSASCPS